MLGLCCSIVILGLSVELVCSVCSYCVLVVCFIVVCLVSCVSIVSYYCVIIVF